jgi:hypothetical protein
MARIRTTAKLINESEPVDVTETASISEVMRETDIVEPKDGVEVATSEKSNSEAKGDNVEEDPNILYPSKASHIGFGKSNVKAKDLDVLKGIGYIGKKDDNLIRFAGHEITPESKDDEVVVFRSFFRAGLWFLMYEMIAEVLKRFEIYPHQLTPNAIVRLSVYIWALQSQGISTNVEGFYRVHELHYQTKARSDGLHKNFGCYNFAYTKDTKAHVLGYHTKYPTGCTSEWFYMKPDSNGREKFKDIVMSPMRLSFGFMRPICNMSIGSLSQVGEVTFRVVTEHTGTWDLVQEYLSNKVFPTLSEWGMSKLKDDTNKFGLVYRFKF